jgi:uncharacterized protein (DUF4415 family)
MSKKRVRRTVDLANLPSLTKKRKAELAVMATGSETSTTVRIDSDVLAWLRAQEKGYQSRINAILRRKMLESLKWGERVCRSTSTH